MDSWFQRLASKSHLSVVLIHMSDHPSRVSALLYEAYFCRCLTCCSVRGGKLGKFSWLLSDMSLPDVLHNTCRQLYMTSSCPVTSYSWSSRKHCMTPPSLLCGSMIERVLISWKAVLDCEVLKWLSIVSANFRRVVFDYCLVFSVSRIFLDILFLLIRFPLTIMKLLISVDCLSASMLISWISGLFGSSIWLAFALSFGINSVLDINAWSDKSFQIQLDSLSILWETRTQSVLDCLKSVRSFLLKVTSSLLTSWMCSKYYVRTNCKW
jgi:hypothetical protein